MRHIHVHLHQHGSSAAAQDQTTTPKAPSTTPKRPPSTLIKPAPQSPHNPPKSKSPIKPMKPAGVIHAQAGTGAHTSAPKVPAGVKAIKGVTKLVETANRLASSDAGDIRTLDPTKDAGTSEGARKAAQSRKYHGGPHATQKEAERHAAGLRRTIGRSHVVEQRAPNEWHAVKGTWHIKPRT